MGRTCDTRDGAAPRTGGCGIKPSDVGLRGRPYRVVTRSGCDRPAGSGGAGGTKRPGPPHPRSGRRGVSIATEETTTSGPFESNDPSHEGDRSRGVLFGAAETGELGAVVRTLSSPPHTMLETVRTEPRRRLDHSLPTCVGCLLIEIERLTDTENQSKPGRRVPFSVFQAR